MEFNDDAKTVILHAQDVALDFEDAFISPDHILLALLRDENGEVCQVLSTVGMVPAKFKSELLFNMKKGLKPPPEEMGLGPDAKRAFDWTYEEMSMLRSDALAPRHVLLGVMRQGKNKGTRILQEHGITVSMVRDAVKKMNPAK